MDQPVTVPVEELRGLASRSLSRAGLADADAAQVVDVLIEAELAGRATHGIMRMTGILERVRDRESAEIKTISDGPSLAHLDGDGELGYLVATRAVDLAVEKALKKGGPGMAVVGARGTSHAGYMGYYVRRAAERGAIALVLANCSARIAPTGATQALLGTNPIAVGLPRAGGESPVVVDFSTAAITNGQLMMAQQVDGFRLPPGLAYDAKGKPTEDPAEALAGAIVPVAGHKGYCLSLLVQILTTAMTGANPMPDAGTDYGIFAAALRPDLLVGEEDFHAGLDQLAAAIGKLIPAPLMPGDTTKGARLPGQRRQDPSDGIVVDPALFIQLKNLGAED